MIFCTLADRLFFIKKQNKLVFLCAKRYLLLKSLQKSSLLQRFTMALFPLILDTVKCVACTCFSKAFSDNRKATSATLFKNLFTQEFNYRMCVVPFYLLIPATRDGWKRCKLLSMENEKGVSFEERVSDAVSRRCVILKRIRYVFGALFPVGLVYLCGLESSKVDCVEMTVVELQLEKLEVMVCISQCTYIAMHILGALLTL